jgi:hypothetical protein
MPEIVAHHLRLFGFVKAGTAENSNPLVLDASELEALTRARAACARGAAVVALRPSQQFAAAFGVSHSSLALVPPLLFTASIVGDAPYRRLRSLHNAFSYTGDSACAIVSAADHPVWAFVPSSKGGIFLLGTDLSADLVRYRQGNPAAAVKPQTEALWGIPGERPIYLYEAQLAGEHPQERHADWWCNTLSDALVAHTNLRPAPILPGNAPGAVVVTGDDDQAPLVDYELQLELLGDLPITYFLHPLTKHDRNSMARVSRGRRVEWALHPDALDAPERYEVLLKEQARWFEKLAGFPSRTVRNHGFLNDRYWRHLPAWIEQGISGSSNVPGVDGRVLNGSLLPARMFFEGSLTCHWSILTAIGDGIMFALRHDEAAAYKCIRDLGDAIVTSGLPGVIVLNLHPANVRTTAIMHKAVRDLVEESFVAWTLYDCLDWFARRDGHALLPRGVEPIWQKPSRFLQRLVGLAQ